MYRDGNLVSGSLEALVQHMVPTEEYYPDRAYLFAFLLSARLFIKPHELLGDVCALCEHQQNLNGEGGKVSVRVCFSLRIYLHIYAALASRLSTKSSEWYYSHLEVSAGLLVSPSTSFRVHYRFIGPKLASFLRHPSLWATKDDKHFLSLPLVFVELARPKRCNTQRPRSINATYRRIVAQNC